MKGSVPNCVSSAAVH